MNARHATHAVHTAEWNCRIVTWEIKIHKKKCTRRIARVIIIAQSPPLIRPKSLLVRGSCSGKRQFRKVWNSTELFRQSDERPADSLPVAFVNYKRTKKYGRLRKWGSVQWIHLIQILVKKNHSMEDLPATTTLDPQNKKRTNRLRYNKGKRAQTAPSCAQTEHTITCGECSWLFVF